MFKMFEVASNVNKKYILLRKKGGPLLVMWKPELKKLLYFNVGHAGRK